MTTPIEDYAVIGDGETMALIGKDGSLDWLCLPRFDSPACFAALLGTHDNGHWRLAPTGRAEVTRRYVEHSDVLETTFETDRGTLVLTDLMPVNDRRADVIRRISCVSGSVQVEHDWRVRLDYGRVRPWVRRDDRSGQEVIVATGGPDKLILIGDRLPVSIDGGHHDEFVMREGETLTFATIWIPSHLHLEEVLPFDVRIEQTLQDARDWASRITYDGPWREQVTRSLVTLRRMTHAETGGIVAAATTSLPEEFGGERNWDYRYCWLRDAAHTLQALLACGRTDEAHLWRGWLLRAIAGDPADMQIMYTVDAGRHLPEHTLDELPGYADSRPVRIGNGAVDQRQTDVLGEVMIALQDARAAGLEESHDSWALQRALVDGLAETWDAPDNGLWEIRGPLQHFTHSRVMVWAAFDRAITAVERHGLDGNVESWRRLRDQVRDEVLTKGFSEERNSFRQHYDTDAVDASLLMIPIVGFLPYDDPRILGTIAAIENDLMHNGLLLRYLTSSGVDGLSGDEHPFLVCSFWLVIAYAGAGRLDEARRLMERLLDLTNDVGLLSEEYDPVRRRMVGNFPQAFSHLGLVLAAVAVAQAEAGGTFER